MTKKKAESRELSAPELQLIERLRQHPELLERFQSILEISAQTETLVKSADEVEGLLVEEMRRLGNAAMGDWATSAEKKLGEQLEQKDPAARARKKKR